ncbi:TIGR03747 family integrating conjugative element membrane protein [Avibacterium endocarditidis]|uniref:TIGR03747 family integrating conjugative element membrane protein n=1 Tax=Avibacterium endocarditidis TaxID=380674 RepID=A0ABX4ZUI1_9PAST|nr:TIGR03747 family integrating conjugative element membrane protein [Avibacterium endocarditidis]POY43191.1 TIGR03747 family integrating conjugative element membrane protein [Avibacterium endocarditidis]
MQGNDVPQRPVKQTSSRPCTLIGVLITSLLLSIMIEWVGIAYFWSEQGAEHSKQVMLTEFNWFSEGFQQSLIHSYPVILAQQMLAFIHHWLFVKTGLQSWLTSPKNPDSLSAYLWFYARAYIESVLYVTMTFIIRLIVIVLTSPLFILVALVGLVDGLVQRDLRRFGIGRESAFKYHHAKKSVGPVMLIAWVIYLSIPFAIHPNMILIPGAVLFGLMISLTASNFKKYL